MRQRNWVTMLVANWLVGNYHLAEVPLRG